MDKFVKRIQTRVSRKGISVSKSQVREVYTSVVVTPEAPSEEEMSAVIQKLEEQYLAPSHESTTDLVPVEQVEQPASIQQEEAKQMTQAQPAAQPSTTTLATSHGSSQSLTAQVNLSVSQQQIQEAVEQQFGKENVETKTAILNYVAQDTFSTAQELQTALGKLRQMKLDILMKLIADHNKASGADEDLLKTALMNASVSRKEESELFFAGFENQLSQMRASFGI